MMKKEAKSLVSVLLVLVMVLSALTIVPFTASAAVDTSKIYKSGDWQYRVHSYYLGQEDDEPEYFATVVGYTGSVKTLKIPEKLGKYAVREIAIEQQKTIKSVTNIVVPKTLAYGCYVSREAFPNLNSYSVAEGSKNYKTKSGVLYTKDMLNLTAYPPAKKASTFVVPDKVMYLSMNDQVYLKSITLPKSLKMLMIRNLPKLTTLSIPPSVEYIWINGCAAMTGVSVQKGNKFYYSKGGVLYVHSEYERGMTYYPENKKASTYTVPDKVESVVIRNNKYLQTINLSKSAGSVYLNNLPKLTNLGIATNKEMGLSIRSCPALKKFSVSKNNKAYSVKNGVLFSKDKKTLYRYLAGNKATSYTVPATVTKINEYAFEDVTKLKSIKLPASVETIGFAAFAGCTNITNMAIPNKVVSIAYATFYGCKKLSSVQLPKKLGGIYEDAFTNCEKLPYVSVPKSVYYVAEHAYGFRFYPDSFTWKRYPNFAVRSYPKTEAQAMAKAQKQKFVDITPKSIKVGKAATIGVNETYALTTVLNPVNNVDVLKWTSSNEKVATVTGGGKVTGKKAGTTTITVTTSNGKKASIKMTVKNAPTKLALNKTSATLKVKRKVDLDPKFAKNQYAYSVTFKSSNTKVATVDKNGVVTAKKKGKATITATTYNGKKASCKITVK